MREFDDTETEGRRKGDKSVYSSEGHDAIASERTLVDNCRAL